MEHSFSACINKSREQQQGSGSAILRWFNLQSITEVKSQLETMHLLFGAPRFLCSREFKDLWLRSEVRIAKSPGQITEDYATSKSQALPAKESIVCKSGAEIYVHRHTWEVPSRRAFLQKHPRTRAPWWQEILAVVGASVCDSDSAAPVFDSDSAGVPGSVHNRRAAPQSLTVIPLMCTATGSSRPGQHISAF